MTCPQPSFIFNISWPGVVYGSGTIKTLPEELQRLDVKSPVLISSPTRVALARRVQQVLETSSIQVAGIIAKAVVHVPAHITDAALEIARGLSPDAIISVGGGAAVGLGKALSLRTGWPHVCIPTTYSGSEMTAILGELRDGKKVAVTDPRILPSTVIYDVDLTMDLPRHVTAVSGLNAMAHLIEKLYSNESNPVVALVAIQSIRCLIKSLPEAVEQPVSASARSFVLYGAFLAGLGVGSGGIALQHKLAHVIAGSFGLPHADTHAILLPHTVVYNLPALSSHVVGQLESALAVGEGETIGTKLNDLLQTLGINTAPRNLGLSDKDVDKATDLALEQPYWNPRELDRAKIRELIRRAWAGEPARADL